MRREIYDMILWWMDKGVGGFRLDVIDQIAKEPDLKITNNGPRLHEFIRELSKETFQKGDLITVGEAWGADTERAKLYSNPDGSEFSMVFQFEHIGLDQQEGKTKWDLSPLPFVKLKKTLAKWQTELAGQGWNSLFWNNHDLPRIVSRWGNDGKYRVESAKMLASVLHGMQGTPYIYQGEELGMTNVHFDDISQYKDIETLHMYEERMEEGYSEEEVMASIYAKGRDNARTPMQWDESRHAGFTRKELPGLQSIPIIGRSTLPGKWRIRILFFAIIRSLSDCEKNILSLQTAYSRCFLRKMSRFLPTQEPTKSQSFWYGPTLRTVRRSVLGRKSGRKPKCFLAITTAV